MLVYCATNKLNGKKYIGYTSKTLEVRIKTHLNKANSKSNYFYLFKNALRKYGLNNFDWDVLEYCNSIEECCNKEIYYISKYNTISPKGYNLTTGGNGGKQCDEVKNSISKSVKNYYNNIQHPVNNLSKEDRIIRAKKAWITKRKKGFKTNKGLKYSENTCNKISESKNKKNAITWINLITGEEITLSATKMAYYTGLSISTFSNIKSGRSVKTKSGWTKK